MTTTVGSTGSSGIGPSKASKKGSDTRKREPMIQYWSIRFTYETVGSWDHVYRVCKEKFKAGRIQLEKGKGGQVHIQGTVHASPRMRETQIHWFFAQIWPLKFPVIDYCAQSKSTAADRYCMKEDTRIDGPWDWNMQCTHLDMTIEKSDILEYEIMYPWAKELVDLTGGVLPGKLSREIHWFWSKHGKMQKTETARYLEYYHEGCIIQGGKKHILATAYMRPAPIYILVIPRKEEQYVSYASIELLKDSLYMSGFGTKATGPVNRKKPWVVIMANFPPDMTALSEDRYVVKCVDILDVPPPAGAEVFNNTASGSVVVEEKPFNNTASNNLTTIEACREDLENRRERERREREAESARRHWRNKGL